MKLRELLEEKNNEQKVRDWIKSNYSYKDMLKEVDHAIGQQGYDDYEEYEHEGNGEAERSVVNDTIEEAEREVGVKLNRTEVFNLKRWLKKEYDFLS